MSKKKVTKLLLSVECEVLPDSLSVASTGSLTVEVVSDRTAPYKITVSCNAPQSFLKLSGRKSYSTKSMVVFPTKRGDATWDVGVPQNCPCRPHQLDIVAEASRLVTLPPSYPRGGITAILRQAEFATVSDFIQVPMEVLVE